MKLTHISVVNYKGLRSTECDLSSFVCAVGENNAGKSSLLQSVLLFINGRKLSKEDFYDPAADVVFTVKFQDVTEGDLEVLTADHRAKLRGYVVEEKLTLARRYSTDGSSKLRVMTKIPVNKKYQVEAIDEAFKGLRGKDVGAKLLADYPETMGEKKAEQITTQKEAKDTIQTYVSSLPSLQFFDDDIPLPTGIDNSVRSLLPEPVYIPAVKDLGDDLKTKEGASFGRLLSILLVMIEDELADAKETFEVLRKKLNRIVQDDGSISDERIERVKRIEEAIQLNLEATFKNASIELEIPPPTTKTVLSNATIIADDGVRGPIDNKGDGFKRAITFSILRTYVQLSQDPNWKKSATDTDVSRSNFLFLFEEPELYLHPRAQCILFEALSLIAAQHQVIVTTHSPLFFSADDTKTFLKVMKVNPSDGNRPFGVCGGVDLGDLSERDKFQLISFESANLAFFAGRIVLVEGDSELIVLPHIARTLDKRWDFDNNSAQLIKTSGKGAFARYREFFERFEVEVLVVADLDILIDDFDKLSPETNCMEIRNRLLEEVDAVIERESLREPPNPTLMTRELQRSRVRKLCADLVMARQTSDTGSIERLVNEIFAFELKHPRLAVLTSKNWPNVTKLKLQLLRELRNAGVFILSRGSIESYYPESIVGSNKPERAQDFCRKVQTIDAIEKLCDEIDVEGRNVSEFKVIMRSIFGS